MAGFMALAVPLPPDFELHGNKCLGFVPCPHGCGEYAPVFQGKREIYASCSKKFVTVRGCTARVSVPDLSDFPAQNREVAENALAENPEIPGEYLEIIKQAWGIADVSGQIQESTECAEISGGKCDEPGTDEPGYSGDLGPAAAEIVATTDSDSNAARNEPNRSRPDPFEGLY